MRTLAEQRGVEIEICVDPHNPDIVMTGLPAVVYDMIAPITEVINKAQQNEFNRNAALLKQNTVQWSYQDDDGLWVEFDVEINQVVIIYVIKTRFSNLCL